MGSLHAGSMPSDRDAVFQVGSLHADSMSSDRDAVFHVGSLHAGMPTNRENPHIICNTRGGGRCLLQGKYVYWEGEYMCMGGDMGIFVV